jgi:hypothetical protein
LAAIVSPPSLVGTRTEVTNYGQAASCRLTESSRKEANVSLVQRSQWPRIERNGLRIEYLRYLPIGRRRGQQVLDGIEGQAGV